MKKLICILLSFVVVISLFTGSFTTLAAESQESSNIDSFIDGITKLVQEYDVGKEFTTPENDESMQIQPFFAENTTDETSNNAEQEYALQDFQTARLIVRADGKFDEFGAKEHVSGFEDFHILQYESPKAAMYAYYELQSVKNVFNVAPDEVVDGLQGETDEIISETELQNEKYLCDWSHDRTQSDRLLDYLETQDFSERKIVVAILDSGIDYHNRIFENRMEYSRFNSSVDGNPDDEFDSGEKCHGTSVASVIVDNTPKNVKVSVYKVFNDDLTTTISQISAGYIAAIAKNPDVINASMTHISDDSGIISACLQEAYSKNIPLVAAIGNTGRQDTIQLPANAPHTIAVSATDRNNTATLWSTQSVNTTVSAPGEDIIVAISNNNYRNAKGTSFATPCVAALVANLKLAEPNITVDEIETRLKNTSYDVKRYNEYVASSNANLDNFHSLWDGVGMVQFCSAFGLPELTAPEFNLESKVYVGEQICSIQCADENAKILYTTDSTYPDSETAIEYNKPFHVTERTRIRAVAYYADDGYYSREVEITPRIQYTDNDENFTVTNDGVITSYSGTVADLFIPDTINGITVTGIADNAFQTPKLISLTLPKGVTEIPEYSFYKNQSLEFVRGEGVIRIGSSAFDSSNIMYAEFPNAKVIGESAFSITEHFCFGVFTNVEEIGSYAFGRSNIIHFNGPAATTIYSGSFTYNSRMEVLSLPLITEFYLTVNDDFYSNDRLTIIDMPSVVDLQCTMFQYTSIRKADFPSLVSIDSLTFRGCPQLEIVSIPSILEVPTGAFVCGNNPAVSRPRVYNLESAKTIGENVFGKSPTSRLELSHLETAESLPRTEECIISMPSTFRECTEDTKGRNYTVYGTKGTYAEQWANENGHTFIEVSQDTAVLTQLPEKYTDADSVLTADVIGFNRTYQWYANDTNDNTTGTPIPNATGKEFNPADYPAKYYYCVVTSTDVGYDPIEIRTNVTENTTYQSADYTEYNKAVEQAKAIDRSLYQDLTALDEALSADIGGLSNAQQNIVDEQTAKIKGALDNLVLKPADYSRVNEQINTVPEHLEYYTDKTVNALNEILNGIDYGLDITKQDVVDSYAEQLQNAISALEYKPADYTEYDKAVAKAKGLDKEKYVDFSQVEKELAVDVGGRNITQQEEEVDLQTKAILAAIDALEEKPQEQPIINPEQDKTNGSTTPDKPSKNESVISPMTGSETYTGAFITLAALSFATVLLVQKKKDN